MDFMDCVAAVRAPSARTGAAASSSTGTTGEAEGALPLRHRQLHGGKAGMGLATLQPGVPGRRRGTRKERTAARGRDVPKRHLRRLRRGLLCAGR